MTTLTLRDAVEVVLEGYTLHEGARKILETAIAQEQPVRSCETCLFVNQAVDQAPCNNCTTNELFTDNWEPKP